MEPDMQTLYRLASAEGEGIGTAYEYAVKLRILYSWAKGKDIRTMMVFGFPEHYGCSMDFFYLSKMMGWKTYAFSNDKKKRVRAERLFRSSLPVDACTFIDRPREVDLLLSCEVIQSAGRDVFGPFIGQAKHAFLFAPNGHNAAHGKGSRLRGMMREELVSLFPGFSIGFCDLPPFPPGIHRGTNVPVALTLSLLGWYGRIEGFLPMKQRLAHIIYAKSTD